MHRSRAEWHARFKQQAGWTAQVRRYLLAQANLTVGSRVLEAGCGTGVITAAIQAEIPAQVVGLDRDMGFLRLAAEQDHGSSFCGGNALALPFADGSFDVVACHFFLLWISEPAVALAEMVRVTRPGGGVLAMAEPDYGGRIDYPQPLDDLGRMQAEALRRQGAAPLRGRELAGLFHSAGLESVQTGVLGGQWQDPPNLVEIEAEWATLEADLAGVISADRLAALRQIDLSAWRSGTRVIFVPTFYAAGKKRR